MDKSVQYAVVVLIVVLILAAVLTRDTGPRASATPDAPADVIAAGPEPGSGEAPATPEPGEASPAAPSDGEAESGQLPRFVEVGADSCVPCKMMQPILDELRTDYAGRLEIEFADVWKNPELGQRYNVQTIPTQVIYDASGREVFRHIGYWPREEIDAKLKELGIID